MISCASAYLEVSLSAAELQLRASVYRPVRPSRVDLADGSLTMIMSGAVWEGQPARLMLPPCRFQVLAVLSGADLARGYRGELRRTGSTSGGRGGCLDRVGGPAEEAALRLGLVQSGTLKRGAATWRPRCTRSCRWCCSSKGRDHSVVPRCCASTRATLTLPLAAFVWTQLRRWILDFSTADRSYSS
jgi:hypothetical protein